MDRKYSEQAQIQRLIQLSAAARGCLSEESAALQRKLDIPARVRGALAKNPTSWLFGSMASGLAASLLLRRKPSLPPRMHGGGLIRTLLGLVLTAIQPMLKVWLTQQMTRWAENSTTDRSPKKNTYPQAP